MLLLEISFKSKTYYFYFRKYVAVNGASLTTSVQNPNAKYDSNAEGSTVVQRVSCRHSTVEILI